MKTMETTTPETTKRSRTRRSVAATTEAATAAPLTTTTTTDGVPVTFEERHRLVAEAAYFRALQRNFQGNPEEDWFAAEAEIEARLNRGSPAQRRS